MQPVAVESTTLAAVAYDARRELLQVEFRDRTIYQYFGVPADVHAALLRAPSKGQYFNRVIRGQFPYALRPAALILFGGEHEEEETQVAESGRSLS